MRTAHGSIPQLREDLHGSLVLPDDPVYDEARATFYGGIDLHPRLIARVADASDVARVVAFARDEGLELAVRGGGHSPAGHCATEGGVVLDLSDMKALEIDVDERTAWAETGLTAAEFTTSTGAHGLAIGFGDSGSVGIGGITLGGGVGFLVRRHGLTIDSLLAADVVTADGELRRVDDRTEPDLFWAIRGGGGNFGVATRLRYRLHEVGTVVGGMLFLPATPETIAGFVALAEAAPDELSTIANVMPAPPMPFVPREHHGQLLIMAMMVYAGGVEAGERAVAPFRALAPPIADLLRPMPYPEMYPPDEEDYHPIAVGRTMFVEKVDRGVADTIVEHLESSTASMRVAQVRVLGGAMARVPADATAFAHRGSRIMVNVAALSDAIDEVPGHEAWVEGFTAALRQGDDGAYVNFLTDEGEARVRAAYPGETWARLRAVKARYDPENLFHRNQNIPPR
jgi:FAD/FMN-containing dehydrogenase